MGVSACSVFHPPTCSLTPHSGHSSKTYRLLHEWPRQRSITQWSTNCFLFQMASHPDFGSWPSEALESSSPPPHIGCLISNDHLADNNQLLRSEVITASSLMREQMRQEPYWDNFLFPVSPFKEPLQRASSKSLMHIEISIANTLLFL